MPLRLRLQRLLGRQHWIRRGRDRLLRRLCNPDAAPPIDFTVPFFGGVYPGRLDNFVDWSVFHYDGYARHELLLLRDIVRALARPGVPLPTFFDVGANIGNHALFMALHGCSVHAFEPFAPVRAALLVKIAANPGLDIRVHDFALGEEDATLAFAPPSGANPGTGSFAPDETRVGTLELPVRQGDAAFAELALPPIGILKIDVEGFEAQVLAGLSARLTCDRPVILFELSERTRERVGAPSNLDALLYPRHRLFSVETRSVSGPYRLRPFDYATASEALAVPGELEPRLVRALKGL